MSGYGLLTRLEGQVRIATLWVRDNWEGAYRLATEIAGKQPDVYEVISETSSAEEERALIRNGYRIRNLKPIHIRDGRGVIGPELAPPVQLADWDSFFLSLVSLVGRYLHPASISPTVNCRGTATTPVQSAEPI